MTVAASVKKDNVVRFPRQRRRPRPISPEEKVRRRAEHALSRRIIGDKRLNVTARLAWLMTELSRNSEGVIWPKRSWMAAVLGDEDAQIGRSLRKVTDSGLFRRIVRNKWVGYERVYAGDETPQEFEWRAMAGPFDLCVRYHWLACVQTERTGRGPLLIGEPRWEDSPSALYKARKQFRKSDYFDLVAERPGMPLTCVRRPIAETQDRDKTEADPLTDPITDPLTDPLTFGNRKDRREEKASQAKKPASPSDADASARLRRAAGPANNREGFPPRMGDPPRSESPPRSVHPAGGGRRREEGNPPRSAASSAGGGRGRRPVRVTPSREAELRRRFLVEEGDTPGSRAAFGMVLRYLSLDEVEDILETSDGDFMSAAFKAAGGPPGWGRRRAAS